MKNIKKLAALFMGIFLMHSNMMAQPKVGAVVWGGFSPNFVPGMVAKVTAVNGQEFTVRFQHSGSDYVFKQGTLEGDATVVSSKGGKFPKGSFFSYYEYRISEDTYECILSKDEYAPVMVRFPDGKSFMGHVKEFTANGGTKVTFWHSWSVYNFDKDGKVLSQTGGAYPKGTQVKIFCADAVGNFGGNIKPPHLMEPKLN